MGAGLQRVLKLYGKMQVGNITWVWDYAKDEPRILSEMTKEEITASEKAKWLPFKKPRNTKQ